MDIHSWFFSFFTNKRHRNQTHQQRSVAKLHSSNRHLSIIDRCDWCMINFQKIKYRWVEFRAARFQAISVDSFRNSIQVLCPLNTKSKQYLNNIKETLSNLHRSTSIVINGHRCVTNANIHACTIWHIRCSFTCWIIVVKNKTENEDENVFLPSKYGINNNPSFPKFVLLFVVFFKNI